MKRVSTDFYENLSAQRKELQELGHLPQWYTTQAWQMFSTKYAVEGEEALLGRHKKIAKTLAGYMPDDGIDWEQKFFDLMWQGILSPASPVLSNVGTDKGMPVSCSGQYVGDSVDSFYSNLHETAMLSKMGFGCSADFSAVRPRGASISTGGKANGVVPVIDDFFTCAAKISQGGARRGSTAAYLDIEHADFPEALASMLEMPDGKNYGWIVKDSFIERLKAGDEDAEYRFKEALHAKLVTGGGYFFFLDKANRHRPEMYKEHGLDIKASNLCSEIMLHSSEELSFSCILSSLNLVHWDTIKATDAVFTATVFLDCLVSYFLDQSTDVRGLEKVREFTEKGRAIGLGVMGFATYLQNNDMPYAALESMYLNGEIFKHIHDESLRASQYLADLLGEPEWCTGHGVRNTHRTALAPTKSTSLLMGGVSESVFPDPACVFVAGSSAGELNRITPRFYELMKKYGKYTKETVTDVTNRGGSVQHLDWLTDRERLSLLTAFEIDQAVLIRYAADRQKYLCQGQSLNLFISADDNGDQIADLMTEVFLNEDILSQYYVYSKHGVVVSEECIPCSG